MIKKIFVLLSILLSFSCSCKKNIKASQNSSKNLYEIAVKKYGEGFDMIYNSNKDFVLIKKEKKNKINDIFPTVFFSIIDTKTNTVIFKDIVPGGKIKWNGEYSIEVKSMLGRPRDILNSVKQNVLYNFDVKSLKKFK